MQRRTEFPPIALSKLGILPEKPRTLISDSRSSRGISTVLNKLWTRRQSNEAEDLDGKSDVYGSPM